jgi:hypothetical protein
LALPHTRNLATRPGCGSVKPSLVFGCAYWRISEEESALPVPYATDSMMLGSLLEGLLTLRLTG